jgi:transglutaminase-like putative cysteine protease
MKHLRYLLIICILNSAVTIKGQEFSREFGQIGKAEADLISYSPDKSAEAVVLFDIGKSHFVNSDRSFDVIFERTTRIKILSDAGIKWAEVEIPFYQEGGIYETVYEIEAYTYNPEGESFRRTVFNSSNCHDEKLNEFWVLKKFALPDVKAGSIIEYRYKISSQYKFNLRDWEFQSRIPTIYSEYEVKMIPFYEYVWSLQGTSKIDSKIFRDDLSMPRRFGTIDFKDLVHKFEMKNVPAFKDEEYISSINDYIIKLDFQLAKVNSTDGVSTNIVSTWPDLIKDLVKDEDVTKFAKKCEKLSAKLLSPDSLRSKSQHEKFDFILNYVKANFNWNNNRGKYASKSPNELLKDKFGNSADLNLLVVGLLNASGIEAFPLIISTRDNGKIKVDYPYLQAFNYVLINATIDGKRILSDATEILCPNDRIPSRCLSEKGLLIKEGVVEWVNLQSSIPSEIETNFSIDSVGINSRANTIITASEYDALRYRNTYGDDKKKVAERGNVNGYIIDEASIIITNPDKKELPYIMKFTKTYKTEVINNKIYLSPFLDEPITDNPLKQYSRTYPIDMLYPVKRNYNSTITIPDGYKVDFVPEDYKILNDLFELNYNVKIDEKTISVFFNYTFKKSVYLAQDYLKLKFYFKDIIKKGNEKVVLVLN